MNLGLEGLTALGGLVGRVVVETFADVLVEERVLALTFAFAFGLLEDV